MLVQVDREVGRLGPPWRIQAMFGGKISAHFGGQSTQPKREGFLQAEEALLPDWRRHVVVNIPIAKIAEENDPNASQKALAIHERA